jgi:YidC/Oxa1 family membrane protein insertase
MESAFVTYIYQPFFNILVGIYWFIGQTFGTPDMGIAVIIFAIVVQIILLPLALSSDRSEKEKAAIAAKIKEIEKKYKSDPIRLRAESKAIMRSNPGAIISETINIIIQVIIILMLYRIFKTGLEGEDLHLLYTFMPEIKTPINLVFLGKFDLSQTNNYLNFLQSLFIFAIEALHMLFSPDATSRRDFLSLAIFLPIFSFLIFMFLPAGKKLFIITSLIFSIGVLLIKQALFWYHSLTGKFASVPEQAPHSP